METNFPRERREILSKFHPVLWQDGRGFANSIQKSIGVEYLVEYRVEYQKIGRTDTFSDTGHAYGRTIHLCFFRVFCFDGGLIRLYPRGRRLATEK